MLRSVIYIAAVAPVTAAAVTEPKARAKMDFFIFVPDGLLFEKSDNRWPEPKKGPQKGNRGCAPRINGSTRAQLRLRKEQRWPQALSDGLTRVGGRSAPSDARTVLARHRVISKYACATHVPIDILLNSKPDYWQTQ